MTRRPPLSLLLLFGLLACSAPAPEGETFLGYGEARLTYIAAEDGGRISAVAVSEGQTVSAGDPAFALDRTRMDLAAESARANASAAAARADRNGVLAQAVRRAEAEAAVAQADLRRSRSLFDRGLVAQARLDADTATARARDAALAQAQAEQAAARTDARAAGATADLSRRRAQDMQVTVPQDGVIHMVYRRAGEVVSAGAPLAAMIAPGDLRVRFFAPQERLARLPPGARVRFQCDGCPDDLAGRVSFVASEPQYTPPVIYSRDQRAKLVFLIEALPDRPEAIRPGLPIDVSLAP